MGLKTLTDESNVTDVTDVTCHIPLEYFRENQNNKQNKSPVTSVTPVTKESDSKEYQQLSCVFCQKGIMDNDWTQDDFTWNRPAHRQCYDEKKNQLVNLYGKEPS